ncbi:hypothetical protein [Candidatus Regiella insecticola]|uniref:hypothetical protein n=1 Tax=Candidatus Regiella insecticola TaxID=138073 RepID=UPI0015966DAC|nr:hypothetical protein [Candidatus Regiella insecticola]
MITSLETIPFAFEAAALLAARPRTHGMSTLIGSHDLAAEGNFKDKGYIRNLLEQRSNKEKMSEKAQFLFVLNEERK